MPLLYRKTKCIVIKPLYKSLNLDDICIISITLKIIGGLSLLQLFCLVLSHPLSA